MNKQYKDYWQECVNCQGSAFDEILCKNEDCPIFYRRIKIKNDLEEKKKEFERFRWEF
jgi:DNA polymerase delta subunit 1